MGSVLLSIPEFFAQITADDVLKIVFGGMVTIAVAVIPSWFAYKQAIKVAHENSRGESAKVDAAAYERAKSLYESGITSLEERIKDLRQQLDEERNVSFKLREQVSALEIMVVRLRRELALAGIEVDLSN